MVELSPHYVFNVIVRAHYMMKRISQQHYFDLQRQFHYLYRGLPVGASILDLPSAGQVKSILKKEKITTDKHADRINATAMKTSVIYAKELIQNQQPVLTINTNEKGATEEQIAVAITEFSSKLAKFSQNLSNKLFNNSRRRILCDQSDGSP